jgi:hypothetical protein
MRHPQLTKVTGVNSYLGRKNDLKIVNFVSFVVWFINAG